MQTQKSWWDPALYRLRRPALLARNRIRRRLTDWFEASGFVEADPLRPASLTRQ